MESPKNKSPVLTIKRAGVRHQNGQWQDFIDREQSSVDHLLRNSFATLCREFKENKNSRNHNTIGGYKINRSKRSSPGSSGKFWVWTKKIRGNTFEKNSLIFAKKSDIFCFEKLRFEMSLVLSRFWWFWLKVAKNGVKAPFLVRSVNRKAKNYKQF